MARYNWKSLTMTIVTTRTNKPFVTLLRNILEEEI